MYRAPLGDLQEADSLCVSALEGDETILVVVNGHEKERSVDLSGLAHWFEGPAEYHDLLSREDGVLEASEDLRVDALGIRILQLTGRSR